MTDYSNLSNALARTGFPFENEVYKQLRHSGWSVISNKYYIDDVDRKARELDLIAYKVLERKDCDLVFSILISCKKDRENFWAFLSRSKPKFDPNNDWRPIHCWTDCEPLKSRMILFDWKTALFEKAGLEFSNVFSAERDFFAYQLVSKDKSSPKDDRPIFQSVSGLMKALDYEKKALSNRPVAKKRVYLFSLATIVDVDMVEASYDSSPPVLNATKMVSQLANYIVDENDVSAVVHFIDADRFSNFLADVQKAAEGASTYFQNLADDAYASIKSDPNVRSYFSKLFAKNMTWQVKSVGFPDDKYLALEVTDFYYSDGILIIELDNASQEIVDKLNADKSLREKVEEWLSKEVRYRGEFSFDWGIPF